jgi:cytochrome b subunit of formate dehydrogenase
MTTASWIRKEKPHDAGNDRYRIPAPPTWCPRPRGRAAGRGGERLYRRFGKAERIGHIGLGISFIGLAITGLPLLYSQEPWARWIAHSMGGFEATGFLHRFFALVMIVLFAWHLARVFRRIIVDRDLGMLWGPYSMVPQPRDVRDVYQNIRYFLGKGEPPRFERYTYWEKFDYWAVFWGMAIIGGSGLILWFPEFFTRFLPGWTLNLASVIHGLEAVLAVGLHLHHPPVPQQSARGEIPDGHGHVHGLRHRGGTAHGTPG